MRKHYDKEFKAKVALEAVRGERTIQEIATSYSVHPNLVGLWKKQLVESAGLIFEKEGKDTDAQAAERRQEELYKQIGQLQVENEFLKKTHKKLFGTEPRL
jgi:transposase